MQRKGVTWFLGSQCCGPTIRRSLGYWTSTFICCLNRNYNLSTISFVFLVFQHSFVASTKNYLATVEVLDIYIFFNLYYTTSLQLRKKTRYSDPLIECRAITRLRIQVLLWNIKKSAFFEINLVKLRKSELFLTSIDICK